MAVAPTGNIFKALEFDGESSKQYGVYITGEAVYNAPERQVEMIAIPGRNGAYALDKGRFENIEVSYPAGIFADNEQEFAQAISDFRNFLCSRKGYVRLTDDYNPTEYRMAIYKSGLEVSPAQLKAGEFEITFECKPQRWLLSGETDIPMTSGDEINNPTLFDASPLLEVEGAGNIELGGSSIGIQGSLVGDIKIADRSETETYNSTTFVRTLTHTVTLDTGLYNVGDTIIPSGWNPSMWGLLNVNIQIKSGYIPSDAPAARINFSTPLVYGTSATLTGATYTGTNSIKVPGSTTVLGTYSYTLDLTMQYDGAQTITFTASISVTGDTSYLDHIEYRIRTPDIIVNSTCLSTSGTIYIDLDIGEAWTDNSGEIASINNSVALPAELPTLVPGSNTITFDNTITSFKIKPRWWKV